MGPFNKYEAIGIFVSVAAMALVLAVLRFESTNFSLTDTADQTGSIIVSGDSDAIRKALEESVGYDGTLKKMLVVVDDVRIGTGKEVVQGDSISVHYIGTLHDGTEFDNSYKRGEPYTFTIGEGTVIKGWDEGLIGMQVGGERFLVIPAEKAYGNRQVGPIPPNAPLIFKVELVAIN